MGLRTFVEGSWFHGPEIWIQCLACQRSHPATLKEHTIPHLLPKTPAWCTKTPNFTARPQTLGEAQSQFGSFGLRSKASGTSTSLGCSEKSKGPGLFCPCFGSRFPNIKGAWVILCLLLRQGQAHRAEGVARFCAFKDSVPPCPAFRLEGLGCFCVFGSKKASGSRQAQSLEGSTV